MLQARYAHETLAAVHDLWGNLDAADRCVASGYAAEVGGVEVWTTMALGLIQASIAVSRNRPRMAQASLERARAAGRGWPISPALTGLMTRVETDVAVLTGDLTWDPRRSRGESILVPETATTLASRARLALAAGDVTAAENLARLVPRPPDLDRLDDILAAVEAMLVEAQVAHGRGHQPVAQAAVRGALELARAQSLVRPFLVLLPGGLGALSTILESLATSGDEFVAALLDALARTGRAYDGRREPEPLIEPLTKRELTILAELAAMRSNDEIAAQFYVSVNTVKSHLKNLYRKLTVTNRREAVRRGRDLRLIS